MTVVTNPKNMNIGYSAKRAFSTASKEYLFWQTVDWSYDLTNIRIYLELLKYFDVVTGVRPIPERILSHIPLIKSIYRLKRRSDDILHALVSLSNYYIIRIFYGLNFHDVQCIGFYPTKLVHSLNLKGKSSFLGPEIMAKSLAKGMRFIEVPINFIPRTKGESKGIKPRALLNSLIDIVTNWTNWGWEVKKEIRSISERRIFRVNEPMFIDEKIIPMIIPLFKYYR